MADIARVHLGPQASTSELHCHFKKKGKVELSHRAVKMGRAQRISAHPHVHVPAEIGATLFGSGELLEVVCHPAESLPKEFESKFGDFQLVGGRSGAGTCGGDG